MAKDKAGEVFDGRDHSDLVRRLDIPNKAMEAFTGS